jgi:hypothetical protein
MQVGSYVEKELVDVQDVFIMKFWLLLVRLQVTDQTTLNYQILNKG